MPDLRRRHALTVLAVGVLLLSLAPAAGEISWFVHLSDIHLSQHEGFARGPDLEALARDVLAKVRPAVILSTGDQVDSKTRFLRAEQQEAEWASYLQLHRNIVNVTGSNPAQFLDVRGNHDTFDVPVRAGRGDFFAQYAATRASWGSRVTVTTLGAAGSPSACPAGLLVGIDFSPEPGLRGPTNFLGWVKEELVAEVAGKLGELQRARESSGCSPALIAYGHYPLGLLAYVDRSRWPLGTEDPTRKRVEQVLMDHGVAAFLCGHLHDKFGLRLHRIWSSPSGALAELETADWKVTRRFRIMAVDEGHLSFVDLKYIPGGHLGQFSIQAVEESMIVHSHIALMSNPPSAFHSPVGFHKQVEQSNVIRALVFRIADGDFAGEVSMHVKWWCMGSWKAGEIEMAKIDGEEPIYEALWNGGKLCGEDGAQVQVVVRHDGKIDSTSERRTVHGPSASAPLAYPHTFIERFTLGTKWPDFVSRVFVSFWVLHLFGILLIPKILALNGYFPPPAHVRRASGDAGSLDFSTQANITMKPSWAQGALNILVAPIRTLCWVSHAKAFWRSQLYYCFYLWVGPWSAVRTLSAHSLGLLFRFGVLNSDPLSGEYSFLNIADTLMVSFRYYIAAVIPCTLWMVWVISCWQSKDVTPNSKWKLLSWSQMLVGIVVWYLQIQMVHKMGVWYGGMAVLLSPGVAWFGPMCFLTMWAVRKDLRKQRTD